MALTLLAILIAALVVLGVVGNFVPRRVEVLGGVGAAVLLAALSLSAIVDGGGVAALTLPLGPPDTAMHLALDPLGASFLLLLSVAALPCAACEERVPLPLAAMALAVLAADVFTLAVGLLLAASLTSWRVAAFAVTCLIVALAPFTDYSAIRAIPLAGWHAIVVLILVLAAAAAMVFRFRGNDQGSRFASLAMTGLAGYILIRVLLDLWGEPQPLWWSVPLLLLGATTLVRASLHAALEETLHAVLSAASLQQVGMAIIAIGVALLARTADLPSVTSLALSAAWLSLVCHVLCGTLLLLCSDAVEHAAGSRRLDRLGGLVHGMPITAMICLLGLFAVAILPPGLGFAAFWLLFQSLLAAARIADLGLQLLIALVAAVAALGVGLAALTAARLFAVVFLGRSRTPRAAVAEEVPRRMQLPLGGLAAFISLLGLLPALALLPAGGWLNAEGAAGRSLVLRTGAETPGYSPIAIAALMAIAGVILVRTLGGIRSVDQRREAAWSGGFAPPPSWLPFGDPRTQYGPISFVEPLQRTMQSAAKVLRNQAVRCRDAFVHAARRLRTP